MRHPHAQSAGVCRPEIIARLMCILLILSAPLAQAQTGSGSGFNYFVNPSSPGTITVTQYTGTNGPVTVPTTINSLLVTGFGNGTNPVFATTTNYATSLIIPSNVTTIGLAAAPDGSHLGSLTIPGSITNFGAEAFEECVNLSNLTLGPGLTYIGVDAFINSPKLTNVTFPSSLTGIGDYAFNSCGLKTLVLPNGLTNIGQFAFSECPFTGITIPASVTSLGEGAFDFTALTNISLPFGLTSVPESEFAGCFNLTNINIPDSVTSIGPFAFQQCMVLTNLIIPRGMTSIGSQAFSECTGLLGIYFAGNAPATVGTELFTIDNYTNLKTFYLTGSTGWSTAFWGYPSSGPAAHLWNPTLQSSGTNFGIVNNQFGFNITGTTNLTVAIEASTNLGNPNWTALTNVSLTNGSFYFTDPQWSNFPARFYGLGFP